MKRLAIITTHPIQYYAPLFQLLSKRGNIEIKVFYTWGQAQNSEKYDPDFGRNVSWDIPLLEGYEYTFLENVSKKPGSHHFRGISNPTIIDEVKLWKPNAILLFGWAFVSHLKVLRYFKGKVPVLFRGDSTLLDEQPGMKTILRRAVLSWVYKHVDRALYVGGNNKKYYEKHGLKRGQLIYAPHAIDNLRYLDKEAKFEAAAAQWRKDLGISPNRLVFLFAGKLESKKNPLLLLEAFHELNDSAIDLVIVGNGVQEKMLKQRFSSALNIHFLDFQNQSKMPAVYNLCNVFVLPSQGPEETWGLSINEAMACAKPVIVSTKCGGAVDLIEEGKNGFIFESGNKHDLKVKMQGMIAAKNDLKEMGRHSFNKIQNFSFDRICEEIEKTVYHLN